MGNDLGQPEIAIAKLFANAYEIIRCRYHLLDVTEHVALIADGQISQPALIALVYESRDLSLAVMSLLVRAIANHLLRQVFTKRRAGLRRDKSIRRGRRIVRILSYLQSAARS
ncbi:hypothetical protein A9174_21100 [Mesorhizobium loti NZP2037]|nr:hypothetical protein [Mesorhizobium loti]ANN58986.1 hypothetical protein A9174_21100 [Mesorhizobium loti NZP2037]